jgi:mono/diheme cytochrome c family protein
MNNPFNTPADRENGARIFLAQCAACHGRDGRGGQGTPDFTTGRFRRSSSDEGLFQIINKGVPGTTMPAFALNARETWSTLAYIRSLSAGRGVAATVKGDASRGAELFRAQGCARCHVEGNAPDLTGIGRFQSVGEIRRSIVEPARRRAAPVFPDARHHQSRRGPVRYTSQRGHSQRPISRRERIEVSNEIQSGDL